MAGPLSLCLFFVLCACLSVGLSVKRMRNPRSRLRSALPSATLPTDPYSYARDTEGRLGKQIALGIATMKEYTEKIAKENKEFTEKIAKENKEFTVKNAKENKEFTEKNAKERVIKNYAESLESAKLRLRINVVTLLLVLSMQPEIRALVSAIASVFADV